MTATQHNTNFGLTFLALLSFTVAFFTARIFTTVSPDTVVVGGGIHFHHFWYGLAMVVIAGWMGIASNHPVWRRVYAVVFGFGGGLIGDEVGLLLTFGDYHSQLTYVFFIGLVCFVALATLLAGFRADLERDLSGMERGGGHLARRAGDRVLSRTAIRIQLPSRRLSPSPGRYRARGSRDNHT